MLASLFACACGNVWVCGFCFAFCNRSADHLPVPCSSQLPQPLSIIRPGALSAPLLFSLCSSPPRAQLPDPSSEHFGDRAWGGWMEQQAPAPDSLQEGGCSPREGIRPAVRPCPMPSLKLGARGRIWGRIRSSEPSVAPLASSLTPLPLSPGPLQPPKNTPESTQIELQECLTSRHRDSTGSDGRGAKELRRPR